MTTMTASQPDPRKRLQQIAKALDASRPSPKMELDHRSPWELLIATILSAQCTDERVNKVTPALFCRYPTAGDLGQAKVPEVEQLIRTTGFFRSKAKNIVDCSHALTKRFGGKVPTFIEELTSLPGVGRKTANVVLGNAFSKPAVVVDTHVKRVANRLDLTKAEDPDRIETDLQQLMPSNRWTAVSQQLLLHGRYVCTAKAPQCGKCPIYSLCRWKGKRPS